MKSSGFSIIGFILSLFVGAISMTMTFAVFDIVKQPYFETKLIFVILNTLVVMGLMMFSSGICRKITVPMFAAVCIVTALYTIAQFVLFALTCTVMFTMPAAHFALFQLLIHLVYFAIVLPLCAVGYKGAKKNNGGNIQE